MAAQQLRCCHRQRAHHDRVTHCFYEPRFLRDGLLQGVRLLFARVESWRHALEAARVGSTSVDDIKQETAARAYVRVGEDKVVHRDVLAREREIVHAVAQLAISAFPYIQYRVKHRR